NRELATLEVQLVDFGQGQEAVIIRSGRGLWSRRQRQRAEQVAVVLIDEPMTRQVEHPPAGRPVAYTALGGVLLLQHTGFDPGVAERLAHPLRLPARVRQPDQ